eukprot:TRINITY_DN4548_c0_g2_i1.p1 TRINITY_DN4548_c0_g2~~TRINITY_DN4548_c0_g2_i1.p1  ORF type:complete len:356 (+),score=78.04 TRINITY_DN4548_c0_g2_i1:115-1182(+)
MNVQELEQKAMTDPSDPVVAFELAKAYWSVGGEYHSDEKYCLAQLKTAARLSPKNAAVFSLMGDYFEAVEKSNEKAKKCFLKAASLDPDDEHSIEALYKMYVKEKQFTLAESLMSEISGKANKYKPTAYLRLGQLLFSRGDYSSAIISYQESLKANPLDQRTWSLLADAYVHQGKFEAALKAFTKAVEIDSTPYDLYQIGLLQERVFDKSLAIEAFRKAYELDPNGLETQFGLGLALLREAKTLYDAGFVHSSLSILKESISILQAAKKSAAIANCVPVLMALSDAYTLATQYPAQYSSLIGLTLLECKRLAIKECQRALHAHPVHSALWLKAGQITYQHNDSTAEFTMVCFSLL